MDLVDSIKSLESESMIIQFDSRTRIALAYPLPKYLHVDEDRDHLKMFKCVDLF